jgi:S-adenosylmethionine:tRNA ribosyltransferase-isomerase
MTSPYWYTLPPERIAQRPAVPRESATMLVVDRMSQELQRSQYASIADVLKPSDLLIFNDTRVIPARLFGEVGSHKVEVLLLEDKGEDRWEVLGRPMKQLRSGRPILFPSGMHGQLLSVEDRSVVLQLFAPDGRPVADHIHACGSMPIPPYIRGGIGDRQDLTDYQTIFAQNPGSVAAPTASLHFTERLLETIHSKGIQVAYTTLHVGSPSFLPVWKGEGTELQSPGVERFVVPPATWNAIDHARLRGGRIIAVGTTVVRALESGSAPRQREEGSDQEGRTGLFITPGYQWRVIDGLVTNFHQPGTTHLLLVEAFIGRELLDRVYTYALEAGLRFLSYGDGMLLL